MSDPPGWRGEPPPEMQPPAAPLAPPSPLPPPSIPPPPAPPRPAPVPAAKAPLWAPLGPIRDYRWAPAVGALLVLFVIVAVAFSLRGLFMPAGFRTPPSFPTPTPTPAGLEFGRAYLFWYNSAAPALAAVNKTLPALNSRCKGSLPTTCRVAIAATDAKLKQTITIINKGNIPACIADDLTRFKSDLEGMDGGLQIALKGYAQRDRLMIAQGLAQFHEALRPLAQDSAAVVKDVKALCH